MSLATDTDILIAGAGPAGLLAAAALATTGQRITLIDPEPPVTDGTAYAADRRSTAFLQPARELFDRIGLWPRLEERAVALKALRIVDLAGEPPELVAERTFEADELGPDPFGWNLLNWQFRAVLLDHLATCDNVEMLFGVSADGLLTRTGAAHIRLSDGSRRSCRLAIAADGRDSALREAAGLTATRIRYGQKSLAFTATHDLPHNGTSTEIYHQGGPFTMVPLADLDGRPASAIVWMNEGPRALQLLKMPDTELNAEMHRRTGGLFGEIAVASPRGLFPILTQRAGALTGERLALIAESAHVLPPIGAQGLNTSVNDIAALLKAVESRDDPGDPAALAAYQADRGTDVTLRAVAIDLFNRTTRSGGPLLQMLRRLGLQAAHDVTPLRKALMRAGMGPPD